MIKKFLSRIFGDRDAPSRNVVVELNDRIQPIDRGLTYEDPMDVFLKEHGLGQVTGGGTYLEPSGEIASCDVRIEMTHWGNSQEHIMLVLHKFEELGAPKGSKLLIDHTGEEIKLGKLEGMALYLDGVNLPNEVYETCLIWLLRKF